MADILVAGSRGLLGTAILASLGDRAEGMDMPELDITDPDSVDAAVESVRPGLIINAAALTDVDRCQLEPGEAFRVHRDGVRNLADTGIRLITISTDHVFTSGCSPLLEPEPPKPANLYGESKLSGEREALSRPGNAVIRTSWLFGRERGLIPWIRGSLIRGGEVRAVADQTACATYAFHLVRALERVADTGGCGVFHCVNPGEASPLRLAELLRDRLGTGTVRPVKWADLGRPAPRPVYSALGTGREVVLPPIEEALEEWMETLE
jgi:dTDP-4-dehydrorhamnose reductase